jgi:CelD/BcsL family acetyltransferase involved in cellulose biosynthesis
VLVLAGRSWEQYVASLSANFRQQLRRKERKLEREHGMRYRLADDDERFEGDLDALFALHEERWPEGASTYASGARKEFQREFARRAFDAGWLRLWFMELADKRAIAAWCGFRFGDTDTYYQAGRDRRWDTASPGIVLLAHSIREAFRDGMGGYSFGSGGLAYKYRFTTDDPGLERVTLEQSLVGRVAVKVAAGARRTGPLAPLIKRKLPL